MKLNLSHLDFSFLYSFIKKKGLARNLAMLLLGVIVIPILIIGIVAVATSYNSIINKSKDGYLSTTHSAGMYFDVIFENIDQLTLQLVSNNTIMNYFSETSTDYGKPIAREEAEKMISNVISTSKYISGIYIVTDKNTTITYPMQSITSIYDFDKIKKSTWYKKIADSKDKTIWINNHKEAFDEVSQKNGYIVEPYAVSAARPFKDMRTNTTLGVLMFDISEKKFKKAMQMIKLSQHGFLLALTPEFKVIAPDNINMKIDTNTKFVNDVINKIASNQEEGTFESLNGKNSSLICNFRSPSSGWTYIGVVPLSDLLSSANGLRTLIIIIAIIFTLIALIVGIFFASRIAYDVEKVTNVMSIAANGDLRVSSDIKRKDEIGVLSNSFNTMTEQIRTLIKKGVELSTQVNESIANVVAIANETSTTSNDVVRAIQEIAKGSSNQAQEANKITERVAGFGSKINLVVEASNEMDKLSEKVNRYTQNGLVTVEDLNNKTEQTTKVTTAMMTNIKELTNYTKSIGKIITLLSNISEQTKLLALNASIEAAKAGEAGRGFSVVAAEIRKLADQSRNSTKDIEEMLRKITNQANNTETAAASVEAIIKEQINSVSGVSKAFSKITNAMSELSNKIEDINKSIQEIDKDKNDIIYSIESISAISEETAASSEEVSASTQEQLTAIEELKSMAEKLYSLAHELEKAMEIFKI
ncbi:methyl-accepting chemotaxis protein [Caldicellulosiruptoraceae bacterium PP1]